MANWEHAHLFMDDAGTVVAESDLSSQTVTLTSSDFGWLNVKDYGAVGDITNDDTAAIQACIDAAVVGKASGGDIRFPPGQYRITDTLVFPAPSGGGIVQGAGPYISNPELDAGVTVFDGPQTIIFWDGVAGGTMIEQQGAQGWVFEHFTLCGRINAADSNRAGIGYLLRYMAGAGAGQNEFRNVSFQDIEVATQMGEDASDNNTSDTMFYKCEWTSCDVCFRTKHIQALNYLFEQPSAYLCKQVIDCENGGNIVINLLATSACGGTGSDDWVIRFTNMTPNTGPCIINGWRAELNTKQLVKAGLLGSVVINGLEEAQADQNISQFSLNGCRLTVRNSRLTTNDSTNPTFLLANGSGGQGAALFLDDVFFDAATWAFNDWIDFPTLQSVPIQIRNSRFGTSIGTFVLEDVNSHLEYGPVNHFGQTTNATDRWINLNGESSNNQHNSCHVPVDSTWLIDAYVVGQEVGGGGDIGAFQRRAVVKNVGYTLSLIGAVQTIGTDFNTDAWGTISVEVDSGFTNVAVLVTGKAATTINWKARIVGSRADLLV